MCGKTPNCSWTNNTCECGSYGGEFGQQGKDYADFCRQNPEKCGTGQSGGFDNSQKREEFEKFCSENPEKCSAQRQPSGSTAPEGRYNPPPPGGYSTDPATGCQQAGGSWVNGSCHFGGSSSSYSTPSESYSSPSYSTPTYQTPSYETPSTVQGAATRPGLFDLIFNFLSGR